MNSKYSLYKSPQESMLMRYFRWFFVKHHLKRCLFCIWIVKIIIIIVVLPSSQLYNYNFQNFSLKATSLYCTLFSLIHYSTVRPHKKLFVVRTVIWPLCSLSPCCCKTATMGASKKKMMGKYSSFHHQSHVKMALQSVFTVAFRRRLASGK